MRQHWRRSRAPCEAAACQKDPPVRDPAPPPVRATRLRLADLAPHLRAKVGGRVNEGGIGGQLLVEAAQVGCGGPTGLAAEQVMLQCHQQRAAESALTIVRKLIQRLFATHGEPHIERPRTGLSCTTSLHGEMFRMGAQPVAQGEPGTVQARLHRADRQIQRRGDLLVGLRFLMVH